MSLARLYVPSHQQERNVRVVGVPCAVSCSAVNLLSIHIIVGRLHYQLYVAAAHAVVSVDNLLADKCRNRCIRHVLKVNHISKHRVFLQPLNGSLLHVVKTYRHSLNGLMVDKHLVAVYAAHQTGL